MNDANLTRTWRVRGWIRVLTVAMPVLFLAPILWPATFNPTWTSGMPADQYPWMATFYVVFAACIWANFRSRIELSGHQLTVTNPWGTTHVDTTDVTEVTPGSWGVEIHRTNHRPLIAFAVQCTFVYLTERPRSVDLAEAVTRREPEWRTPCDPDD